jgi:hypothetical protein
LIKQKYIKAPIHIFLNWDIDFHVHIHASLLVVGVMLAQNLIGKHDQPIVYTFKLLNIVKENYNTTEHEALVMVFALHKFKHYLLGNKFMFYVDHMARIYLMNQSQVLGRITRWLLLILEYDFMVIYK